MGLLADIHSIADSQAKSVSVGIDRNVQLKCLCDCLCELGDKLAEPINKIAVSLASIDATLTRVYGEQIVGIGVDIGTPHDRK